MFRVGQKVVCVNASGCAPYGVVEGGVYTIAAIHDVVHGPFLGTSTNVKLEGIVNTFVTGFYLQSFASTRFRPLTDTSISTVLAQKAPRDSRQWDNRKKQKERV